MSPSVRGFIRHPINWCHSPLNTCSGFAPGGLGGRPAPFLPSPHPTNAPQPPQKDTNAGSLQTPPALFPGARLGTLLAPGGGQDGGCPRALRSVRAPSGGPRVCPSVCQQVQVPTGCVSGAGCLSGCPWVGLGAHQWVQASIPRSVCWSVSPGVHLWVCRSVCGSVQVSVGRWSGGGSLAPRHDAEVLEGVAGGLGAGAVTGGGRAVAHRGWLRRQLHQALVQPAEAQCIWGTDGRTWGRATVTLTPHPTPPKPPTTPPPPRAWAGAPMGLGGVPREEGILTDVEVADGEALLLGELLQEGAGPRTHGCQRVTPQLHDLLTRRIP